MSAMLRNKGFTLLEILIAMLLLGILTTVLYSSYFTVVKARNRITEGAETRRELANTLDLIRREISSAVYSRDDNRLLFIVDDRDNFGKPASKLEFTTLAPPSNATRHESGLINVQYRMLEKDKRLILTRHEQDLHFSSLKLPSYPQMEQINSFLVECYDGSKWVKSWDARGLNYRLPTILRITIQVEEDGKPVEFYVYATPRVGS